ncbi:hypothetical protein [Oceanisphaera psychrotolerans]|nr:hypothetical protein [Oceanisphaera psychrotolerans]
MYTKSKIVNYGQGKSYSRHKLAYFIPMVQRIFARSPYQFIQGATS